MSQGIREKRHSRFLFIIVRSLQALRADFLSYAVLNMRKMKRYIGVLLLPLLMLSGMSEVYAGGGSKTLRVKRILLIDSHSSSDVWTEDLRNGLQHCLTEQGVMANYENFELGVRYRPGIVPSSGDIEALRTKLASTRYDLIVTSNNAATDLFLAGELPVPAGTPLLASSYNGPLAERIPAGMNLTGIETARTLPETIALGRRLKPEVRSMVVVVDASADGRFLGGDELPELLKKLRTDFRVLRGSDYTTDELLEQISALPKNTVLLFHSWASSREEEPENSYTALPQIRQRFSGLILGRFDCYMQFGSAGGHVVDGEMQGRQAGAIALRLLAGERASGIPVQKGGSLLLLDEPELVRSGVQLEKVPPDATLLNVPPGFLIRYRGELAYAALAACFLFLLGLAAVLFRRQAQRKMEVLFRNLPMRIAVVDEEERVLYAHIPDDAAGDFSGGFERLEQLPDESREQFVAAVVRTFRTGERCGVDYTAHRRARHAEFVLLPRRNPFHTNAVMWISGDMTELHEAHLEVAQTAERFRLTLEAIGDGVIVTDPGLRVTLVNPVAAELTGYSAEDASGRKLEEIFDIVSYLDGSKVESPLKKALATDSVVALANHTDLIARDGTRRHIADSAAPIRDAAGRITGGVLVFRDVTEEYEKRDRLRLNGVILKNAAKLAKFIYFCCDEQQTFFVSEEDSGFWPKRDGKPVPAKEWILPEYLGEFEEGWRRLRSGEAETLNLLYAAGFSGEKRYFELRMERSVNEISGRREFCGIIQEVTEARENDLRCRDSLKLLESIRDNLPGYLFVKEADNEFRYLMCNHGFEELTGMSSAQILGKIDPEVFPMDEVAAAKFRDDDVRLVESGGQMDMQEFATNAQGRRLIVRTIKNVITRSDGTRLLIGMGIDISRQYHLEQEQKRTINTLNDYVNSERIINQSLTRITLEEDFDRAVNGILRIIGENAGADRCYIFRYTDAELTRCSNEYEWVRDGVEPAIDMLQNVDMTRFSAWTAELAAGRDIVVPDMTEPPEKLSREVKFLEFQHIRSLLVTGIQCDGKLYGYVGLDFVRERKEFSDCDIHTVHSIVNLFLLAQERFRQLERIADSVALQRQIVESITIPITIVDPEYRIISANPSVSRECGRTPAELAGTKCYETVCRNPEPPPWCPVRLTLLDGQEHRTENELNNRRIISTAQPLLDRQGKLMYVLTSDIDITELSRQKQELQKAMEQAQAADRAKSYFLATVSHELRTPLNAVIGFSELLQGGDVAAAEQLEYLRSISFAGNALLNLINDVLDLSKLEADQLNLVLADTDAGQLVQEVVAVFRLKAMEKDLKLTVECVNLVQPLRLDNLRLRQVVLNLVGNAVKFTSAGSVSVRAVFQPDPGGETGMLIIRVADTGPGISPESRKKIFDPFVQGESTRGTHSYEGSGLGLAISQRLVNRMGGEIRLESELGSGSVFTVRINQVQRSQPGSAGLAVCRSAGGGSMAGSALRVLLVDDVPMNLKVLGAMLKKLNIRSVSANSGPEALRLLAEGDSFDLVLTDLWMPEMSGSELAEILAGDERFRSVPVVAVTADTQAVSEAPKRFQGILLKPITPESLEKIIREVLEWK